jgi:hypothetical protein
MQAEKRNHAMQNFPFPGQAAVKGSMGGGAGLEIDEHFARAECKCSLLFPMFSIFYPSK